MRTVKALIAYDGTRFAGWQVQRDKLTVQSEVENALGRIEGRKVRVTAASRTDSGVHAEGQTVHFRLKSGISDVSLKKVDVNVNFAV